MKFPDIKVGDEVSVYIKNSLGSTSYAMKHRVRRVTKHLFYVQQTKFSKETGEGVDLRGNAVCADPVSKKTEEKK